MNTMKPLTSFPRLFVSVSLYLSRYLSMGVSLRPQRLGSEKKFGPFSFSLLSSHQSFSTEFKENTNQNLGEI
jgi:hypothetical protein